MPESVEEYYGRIADALDEGGRLPVDPGAIPNWDVFPFEADGLRLKAPEPLAAVEAPRGGEDPATCPCEAPDYEPEGVIWEDGRWVLSALEPSGSPLVLLVSSKAHHDFSSLPDEEAGEVGRLLVRLAAAVEQLPSVARAHVSRWGDGGAHLHVFVLARPARMPQLRGTCMALWDDVLPAIPRSVRDENARFVAERLVAGHGGWLVHPPTDVTASDGYTSTTPSVP